VRIFIDIDGVLAAPNDRAIARLCNDEWRLDIDDERIAQCRTLDDFKALPKVEARHEARGTATFDFELGWMRFKPRALLADIVLSDSVAGVERLAQIGDISYLTARYSLSDIWQQGITEATQRWLEEHRFVNPCDVIYCNRIEGKLEYLLGQAKETDERLVLVDDSYVRILELVTQMSSEDRELLHTIVLVAKSCSSAPPCADLRVLPLHRWRDIDEIVSILKGERPQA